ncbi:hypothetical protein ACTXT7_009247 [Hymenolepis weldensis]
MPPKTFHFDNPLHRQSASTQSPVVPVSSKVFPIADVVQAANDDMKLHLSVRDSVKETSLTQSRIIPKFDPARLVSDLPCTSNSQSRNRVCLINRDLSGRLGLRRPSAIVGPTVTPDASEDLEQDSRRNGARQNEIRRRPQNPPVVAPTPPPPAQQNANAPISEAQSTTTTPTAAAEGGDETQPSTSTENPQQEPPTRVRQIIQALRGAGETSYRLVYAIFASLVPELPARID